MSSATVLVLYPLRALTMTFSGSENDLLFKPVDSVGWMFVVVGVSGD